MRKNLSMSIAGLASMILAGGTFAGWAAPVANAATSQVTLTYPANNLETLDPIIWSGQILVDQGTIFEGLFGYNQKNQVVPKIAEKWQVSGGGRIWTIWLRHNARWSNGQPVTAEDFYYSWMRMMAPSDSTGATWASVASDLENGYAYHAGAVPASAVGVKMVNPYELKLTLTGAMNIEGVLAIAGSMPLYPPAVEQHPSTWWEPKYFVGDGPYVVHSFVPNGKLVLTRNRDYVGHPGAVNVGNVQQINLIPLPTVPVEDYEAGTLDVALIGSASDYQYALQHFKGQVHKQAEAEINYLGWDHSIDPSPLDNQKVREAIAMAINRAPIVDPVLNNMVGSTPVFAYKGFPTYSLEHNPYAYNVTAARKLLAQAGYRNGKGMPTLYLYTQTTAASPQSVAMGEAVAQELKSALGLTFKIEPTNSTEYGLMSYGGTAANILPGYAVDTGVANWDQTTSWTMGADQWVSGSGSGFIGSAAFRKYTAAWYLNAYDPRNVAAWGNPTNKSLGVSYASWQPIIAAAKKDIAYLNAWRAKQPAAYRAALITPGAPTDAQELANFEHSWKTAKTAAAKHAAWQSFWEWVGTYSTGSGAISLGLNGQVYLDQHEPTLEANMRMWEQELNNTASNKTAAHLAATAANAMMASAYVIPLNYGEGIFLEKPNVTGAQINPWSWQNFYQMQYLSLK